MDKHTAASVLNNSGRMFNFAKLMSQLIKIAFVFLLVFVQPVWAQQDSVWNQKDENGLKHGKWKDVYPGGQVRYEGQFRHGEPFDVFKYYLPNGDLKTVLNFDEADSKSAYGTLYYGTGDKMAEGRYKDQKKQGLWKTYGADEVLLSKGTYVSDKKYGVWKTYHRNGQIAREVMIENNLEQGPLKEYFEDGQLKQEATYQDGFKVGKTVIYTPEGDTSVVGSYYKDARDGEWRYYNEKNEIEKVIKYDKGKLLTPETGDGEVESMEEFKDQRKDRLEFEDLRGTIKYE